jgi:hypothetical protein
MLRMDKVFIISHKVPVERRIIRSIAHDGHEPQHGIQIHRGIRAGSPAEHPKATAGHRPK